MNTKVLIIATCILGLLTGGLYYVKTHPIKVEQQITQVQPPLEKPQDPKPVVPEKPKIEEQKLVADSYKEALEMSAKDGRKIIIFFTSDSCGWCKKMKEEVYTDASVTEALSKYILLTVDTGADRNVSNIFGVRLLPTHVITDKTQIPINKKVGYMNSAQYIEWLQSKPKKYPRL